MAHLYTLVRARLQLFSYVVVLSALVLAFAMAFNLALGTQLGAWRGIGHSVLSLLRFILGEVDIHSMTAANPALSTLLYLAFFFFVALVGIHIFLAIVTEAYVAERTKQTDVNLPGLLRAAAGRQLGRVRAWRQRRVAGVARGLSRLFRWLLRYPPPSDADSPAAPAPSPASASFMPPAPAEEEDEAELTNVERAERALQHIAKGREAMEGGHTFVLNEVRTQLKSLCFRHDAENAHAHGGPNVRPPLQAALTELERHAALNDALKARALREGWVWDLQSAQLHKHAKPEPPPRAGLGSAATDARDADATDTVACARCLAQLPSSPGEGAASGGARGADEYEPEEEEEDRNGFSLERAIAFTRAMAIDNEPESEGGARHQRGGALGASRAAFRALGAKQPHHKHRHKHKDKHA